MTSVHYGFLKSRERGRIMLFILASFQFFSVSSEDTFAFSVYLTCFDVKIYSV